MTIRNDVFMGFKNPILSGVNIGSNAIIAAGSLVKRDVKAGTVVGGCQLNKLKLLMTL